MPIFHTVLAFACLPLAASTQPGCDLGGCDENALLQRDVLAKSIDRHSLGREAVAPAPNTPEASDDNHEILERLESLKDKTDEASSELSNKKDAIGLGQNLADTIKCLKAGSSGCSKPKLAEHVLGLLSAGLAMADVFPEVAIFASLGEIALELFFPSSKKSNGPPALTLKSIGDVVKGQLLDFKTLEVGTFDYPSISGALQTKVKNFEMYLTIGDGSNISYFTEFKEYMSRAKMSANFGLQIHEGWNAIFYWFEKNIASQLPFNRDCLNHCPAGANNHWNSSDCVTAVNNVTQKLTIFKAAASYLSSFSNSMALLASIAQGVYKKYNQSTDGLSFKTLLNDIRPTVKTGYRVTRSMVTMSDNCGTLFTGWANSSGTNMLDARTTDRGHNRCDDVKWNGYGWTIIAGLGPLCNEFETGLQFGFGTMIPTAGYANGSYNNYVMHLHNGPSHKKRYGNTSQLGYCDSARNSNVATHSSRAKEWWTGECQKFLGSLQLNNFILDQMCDNLWGQFEYDDGSFLTEPSVADAFDIDYGWRYFRHSFKGEEGGDWNSEHNERFVNKAFLRVCARPQACATEPTCSELFTSPDASFGWSGQ